VAHERQGSFGELTLKSGFKSCYNQGMRAIRSMALWPGLPNLWFRGELYSLVIAILFAVLLNLALLASFYWSDWLTVGFVRCLWGLLAVAIIGSALQTFFQPVPIGYVRPSKECDELLKIAHVDYLRGQYLEAEASLHKILAGGHEDIEAALLLASIFRRTGRFRQALSCLAKLELLDQSRKWFVEIAKEKSRNLEHVEAKDLTTTT